jgi:phage terminase large subunit-like protein
VNSFVLAAEAYRRDVLAGTVPACNWVRRACERQARDLERVESPDWPWVFDADRAARPCEFISGLPHLKGKWARARELIRLEAWQCFILTTVFGWVHRETGLRRFRRAYVEVPRKNGKSAISSGLLLYLLAGDGEAGAEVYSAATTKDQARITFDDAKRMAERTPAMCRALGVRVFEHHLAVPEAVSVLKPLSAEGSTLDGLNIHGAVVDELHAHKTRAVYDVLDSGTGSRDQPMIWMITTAGSDRAGVCYEQRTHVTKILQRSVEDETFFGIVYTVDDGDAWDDPTTWAKCNPNFGVSVLEDDMEAAARKAASMPSALNGFLTKRLNVWVNADSAWMDMRSWDACADPTLREEDWLDAECFGGLDLASKVDIAAFMRVYRRGDQYAVFGSYYLPERAVESGTNSQYDGWRRRGLLTVTDGEVTDYDRIEDDIVEVHDTRVVTAIGFDPAQATQLVGHLLDKQLPMVEIRPTVLNFSEPMKELEALVLKGRLKHNGDPVLTWMVSNVVCHRDAKDNIYPRKERPENKIDGVVALITALNRAIVGASIHTGEIEFV